MQFDSDITADCACVSYHQQLKHTYRPSGWRIKQKVINKSVIYYDLSQSIK